MKPGVTYLSNKGVQQLSETPEVIKKTTWFSRNRNWVVEIISSLLVLLFAYAAISKRLTYSTFVDQLNRSPFLQYISNFTSVAIPTGELLISVALLFPKIRLLGLYASFALMLLFTSYIYIMLHYSYYIPCSCGGV